MIYPEKINAKKGKKIITILLAVSVIIAMVLLLINKLTKPNVPWAALANAGIIYVWVTVLYAINKNTNIAKHVLIQTIAVSLLSLYIDNRLGFKGWSVRISIPIIIITANVTMFLLTIISRKKYINYAVYQLIIITLSLLPLIFVINSMLEYSVLTIIAFSISATNFVLSSILCARDFKEIFIRKFHM